MLDEARAIETLNRLNDRELHDALEKCCGATRWVQTVGANRPFEDVAAMFATAEAAFERLERADWLEAFSHHPQIGDIESLRAKFATTRAWAGDEQAGTSVAAEATLRALAKGNAKYLQKFGYIFIICATGKSADEMLAALQARLPHSPEVELPLAAQQQKQITFLRLNKLLESLA
jgi:2-oxo-4-hydroxy-4-carboxy-5-ureidoimidazoline decarboxylase